ncbi:MAG: site-2 protease family protein [Bacillota bacterium]|nr:site-2 protease family protein [Bacillota bacterium]
MGIVWTIVILGVMIFIHELGHFMAARAFKVHVEEFSMGMGPAIFKNQKGETLYSIRLFPIGGFCKMEGEDEDVDKPGSLLHLKPWKRLIILVAGATMNVLLALILYISISFGSGNYTYTTRIGEFASTNAPMTVFQKNDKILKMDNTRIFLFDDITLKMMTNKGESVNITVLRGGEKITKTITPYKTDSGYKLGFSPKVIDKTFFVALKNGVLKTLFGVKLVFWSLWQLLSGKMGIENMSGPVGIASVVGQVAKEVQPGGIFVILLNMLNIMALIGVNLGVMNLLPLPALDGGRVVFTLVEMITKRRVNPKVEGLVHTIGMVILLLFAVFITYSDILKLVH